MQELRSDTQFIFVSKTIYIPVPLCIDIVVDVVEDEWYKQKKS